MRKRKGWTRFYTEKSFKLMKRVRLALIIISSPIWIPFTAIMYIGYFAEDALMILDSLLDRILDKIIPQIK